VTIGVLALQGEVREHESALAALGVATRLVRDSTDVDGLAGLILPGGESTTLSMLLASSGLHDRLVEAFADGLPVFGTCAGMILLATRVLDGRADQQSFSLIDLTIRRNGFGRQIASFECDLAVPVLGEEPVHAVFIRAPVVEKAGPSVEVLATLPSGGADGPRGDGQLQPVVCRQGSVLTASFHPELTGDRRLHQLFVEMTKEERR
jgi:5'-phosphate synthase pdxT subunit